MTQPPPPARVPESMGPNELGLFMRGLREKFSLSPQDVSARLHIRVRYVTAIEEANYEALPGKVYARGYVQTYAEFLGLDGDQVAAQCFPPDAVVVAPGTKTEFAPKMVVSPPARYGSNRAMIGIALVILAAAVIGYSQFNGSENPADDVSTVGQVPETLLATMRGAVMPTARNYSCLTTDSALACFFAQPGIQQLYLLHIIAVQQFADEIQAAEDNAPDAAPKEPVLPGHTDD